MMNRGNAELEQLSLSCAQVSSSHHVLEIGFGNGKLLQQLCKQLQNGKVYGADISQDLINQVSTRLKTHVASNTLELHLAGVSQLPIKDETIDTIITTNTIYFWPNPAADAKELLRVLKPNGKLVIGFRTASDMKNYRFVTENLHIFKNHYTENQVTDLLLTAGFTSVEIKKKTGDLAASHVAIGTK